MIRKHKTHTQDSNHKLDEIRTDTMDSNGHIQLVALAGREIDVGGNAADRYLYAVVVRRGLCERGVHLYSVPDSFGKRRSNQSEDGS